MSNELLAPPRRIPINLTAKCLFAGIRYQISFLILGFATVFFLVFAFDYSSILFSVSEIKTINGTLTHKEKTIFNTRTFNAGSGLPTRKGEDIYKYLYRYSVAGKSYKASSYSINMSIDKKNPLFVEYLTNTPSISRIQGMSPGIHLSGGLTSFAFVIAIILIAFSTVYSMTYKRARLNRLLKDGLTATGTVKTKKLLAQSSGRKWHEVVYEFIVDGRCYQIKDRPYYTERIEIGEQRTLLYDQKNPHKAALIDNLPFSIVLDGSGQIRPGSLLSTVTVLLIPIASTILMVISIYFEFFG